MSCHSLTEWSAFREVKSDKIKIEAWLTQSLPIGFTGMTNTGIGKYGQPKGSRGARVQTFYRHEWNVPVKAIRRTQQGLADGWTVRIDGWGILILSFVNRKQNPNFPIQSLEELRTIMEL